MVGIESDIQDTRHGFVFHGKAGAFFLICLGNFLLSVVTLGIYIPWALVKSRRYIYENMELNGVRFKYSATGGAYLVSWWLLGVFFTVLTILCDSINPLFSFFPIILLWVLMPLMMVKGIRYQAMMTQLNDVRFGFKCGAGKAMWTMLGVPVLLGLAVCVFIGGVNSIMGTPKSLNGGLIQLVTLIVLGMLSLGIANGIIYGKWMQLLGNNACFGVHSFSADISMKNCIVICTATMLIMITFFMVIVNLMGPFYKAFAVKMPMGGVDSTALALEFQSQIIMSYLLYFAAIMLMNVFAMAALRNLFMNGLRLGDSLTFRSSLTFVDLLMQVLVLSVATMCTAGLVYPWARMRYLRYLASHTHVVGNLDALELTDSDELNDTGFLAVLSRGIVPAIPFI
jgi:uncharacterized membrane protein YjgN (DUF898 family)